MNCSTHAPISTRSLLNLDENVALDATIQELAHGIRSIYHCIDVSDEGIGVGTGIRVVNTIGSGDHHILILVETNVGCGRRIEVLNVIHSHDNERLLIE